jgi:murein DD-endopeptidase MepM/ murein hydrolase activator NlpD
MFFFQARGCGDVGLRILLWVLCLVSLAASDLQAQGMPATRNADYHWPLDVAPVLVSSFGEFRATHLHAGLDLSTGGRSGLRCYAVGDGWVARMRMSPFGYGKALYVQLDVGPLVVYAHLSRFAGEIAERAWAEQLRRKGFSFDVYLQRDELRVRRGDVIAWSGASGIGHPHLHFEVREGDVARNPQTAGFAVRDKLAPTILDIAILPLSVSSHVEGGDTPHVIPAARATAQRAPVRVAGELGFAVQAYDKAADGSYRQAP